MLKILLLSFVFFLSLQTSFSQQVEIPRSSNDVERILKKDREEIQTSKNYFAEDEKCRNLTASGMLAEAETVCKLTVIYAEKLPDSRRLEKSSAYQSLAIILILQRRAAEAIPLLNQSLEVDKQGLGDTDAETGERYYWLGQANQLLGKVEIADSFYTKAENTYRTAFKAIDDDEIRENYPQTLISILKAHLILLKNADLQEQSAKIERRLAETKIEFARFLKNNQ